MKLLISPGFPRCGTSYLYHQLANVNAELFNCPPTKEPSFFTEERGADAFAQIYDTHDDTKYYLDFSAGYLLDEPTTIERIIRWSQEHTVKCLVVLRHPVEQAFSHYLYHICAHVTKFDVGHDVAYDLFSRYCIRRYLTARFDRVKRLHEALGQNLLVLNFHRDIPRPDYLHHRLEEFLELPLAPFMENKVNVCGFLPLFLYGDGNSEVLSGNRVAPVPEGALLTVSNRHTRLWPDFDASLVDGLHRGAATWCRTLDVEQCEELYRLRFQRQFEDLLSVLGEVPADYPMPAGLAAAVPTVLPRIFRQLPKSRKLSDYIAERLGKVRPAALPERKDAPR